MPACCCSRSSPRSARRSCSRSCRRSRSSRPELATALKEHERGGGRRGRALSTLVVSEVAVACLLLTASGLLIESFARIQNRRIGFVSGNVLTFWVRPPGSRYPPASGPATVDRLLARMQAVPGVELGRGESLHAVQRLLAQRSLFFPDRPVDPSNAPGIGRHYISADYFRTLGIPVLAGRALTPADRAGSAAGRAGQRNRRAPLLAGRESDRQARLVRHDDRAVLRSGACGGDRRRRRRREVSRKWIRPDTHRPRRLLHVVSAVRVSRHDGHRQGRAARATALLPAMRTAVASVDPSLPIYDAMTLDERIGGRRRAAALQRGAAGARSPARALLLAAIGVYGVLSYSVSSRMREIGVRLALGADARRVIGLVLGEGLRLAAIGAAAGLVAALIASRFMQAVVIDVSATDPRILAISAVVMMTVAALAAFLPARRASSVDPIVVLRTGVESSYEV